MMTPEQKQQIRNAVRFFYDIQKLRIQTGNRPITSSEEDENAVYLDDSDAEFMTRSGDRLEALEKDALGEVKRLIKDVPIYKHWLKNQRGCGVTMSGVLISEINIENCHTVSKLWMYCGLGLRNGQIQKRVRGEKAGFNPWLKSKIVSVLADCIIKANGISMKKARIEAINAALGEEYLTSNKYLGLLQTHYPETDIKEFKDKKGFPSTKSEFLGIVMKEYELTTPGSGGWVGFYENYKHRKTSQIVPICMNCNGTGKAKEKPRGIAGGSPKDSGKTAAEIVCGNCQGTGKNAPWGKGPKNRDSAAKRYMMKMFLQELYRQWRPLEGLPVTPPYSEVYLAQTHGSHGPDPKLLQQAEERIRQREEQKTTPKPRAPRNKKSNGLKDHA
jgi:hypothetical protein